MLRLTFVIDVMATGLSFSTGLNQYSYGIKLL